MKYVILILIALALLVPITFFELYKSNSFIEFKVDSWLYDEEILDLSKNTQKNLSNYTFISSHSGDLKDKVLSSIQIKPYDISISFLASQITDNNEPQDKKFVDIYSFIHSLSYSEEYHTPEETIEKQIGNCRALSELMVSLLRHEGFEAYVNLVKKNDKIHTLVITKVNDIYIYSEPTAIYKSEIITTDVSDYQTLFYYNDEGYWFNMTAMNEMIRNGT